MLRTQTRNERFRSFIVSLIMWLDSSLSYGTVPCSEAHLISSVKMKCYKEEGDKENFLNCGKIGSHKLFHFNHLQRAM